MPTEDRTRSLEHIEALLAAAGGVEATIRTLLEQRSPLEGDRGQLEALELGIRHDPVRARDVALDVLEVGFGHGRALLELAWRLRDGDVRFHGVDAGYKSPIQRPEDLLVDKLAPGRLALELDRDDELTMNGRNVPLRNRHRDVRGGMRSVYNVRTPLFDRLASAPRS